MMNELKADDEISLLVSPGGMRKLEVMPLIPEFIREKYNSEDYDPLVVSFGPYHHGHSRLKFVEDFKPTALELFVRDSRMDEKVWMDEVLEVIDNLRDSYVEGSTGNYSDAEFARMMLQDGCLVVMSMKAAIEEGSIRALFNNHLGWASSTGILRDLYLLENQIPFWFFKRILHRRYGELEGDKFWRKFQVQMHHKVIISEDNDAGFVEDHSDEPAHFVEALKRTYVAGWKSGIYESNNIISKIIEGVMSIRRDRALEQGRVIIDFNKDYYAPRSVTELKAKGIKFSPNSNHSFKNITFHHSCFYGTLKFPVNWIHEYNKVIFTNMIAYEMIPNGRTQDFTITAYIHFMKTLLQTPEDVEELQNKGVIINMIGNDEHVLNLYNDISTFRISCTIEFHDVCRRIQEHYNSRARTWLAEFLHTYFRSPWTVIALIASVLVIFLTFIQAYYAANPKGENKHK